MERRTSQRGASELILARCSRHRESREYWDRAQRARSMPGPTGILSGCSNLLLFIHPTQFVSITAICPAVWTLELRSFICCSVLLSFLRTVGLVWFDTVLVAEFLKQNRQKVFY